MFVEFENVPALDQHYFPYRTMHRPSHLGMQLELPVFSVDRNEILGLHQIDNQFELFLAGMSADVNWRRRAVFVDHVRFPAKQVIDHAVNSFLIAWDDA